MRLSAGVMAAAALFLMVVGCGPSKPKMQQFGLRVKADPSLKGTAEQMPTMRVDVVGVQAVELPKYEAHAVDQWFNYKDDLREGSKPFTKQLEFGPQVTEVVIERNDPIWQTWKAQGAMNLVVFANLPPGEKLANATQDPRKYVLPLDKKMWENPKEVRIEIRASKMTAYPPPVIRTK